MEATFSRCERAGARCHLVGDVHGHRARQQRSEKSSHEGAPSIASPAGRSPCTLPRMGAQRVDRQLWVALCGGALHVRASTAEAALDDEEVEDDEDAAVLTVNQCPSPMMM